MEAWKCPELQCSSSVDCQFRGSSIYGLGWCGIQKAALLQGLPVFIDVVLSHTLFSKLLLTSLQWFFKIKYTRRWYTNESGVQRCDH